MSPLKKRRILGPQPRQPQRPPAGGLPFDVVRGDPQADPGPGPESGPASGPGAEPQSPAAPTFAPPPIGDPWRAPLPEPEPSAGLPAAERPSQPSSRLVVRFRSSAAALVYLGAIHDPDNRPAPVCHMSPDGRSLWIAVPDGGPADAEVAETTGGVPQLSGVRRTQASGRHAVGSAARAGTAPPGQAERVDGWPVVNWVHLAAAVAGERAVVQCSEVTVFTRGALARWIIRRCREHAASVLAAPVLLVPIAVAAPGQGSAAERRVMRLRISARGGALPAGLLDGFLALPGTEVSRAADRLLLPHRAGLPIGDRELATHVPPGETWLIAADGGGVWAVREPFGSREFEPPLRLSVPPPRAAEPVPPGWDADLSTEVRVVEAAADERLPEAILVRDEELPSLRGFLAVQAADDALQLVPGPGVHLITEPGGLSTAIPFGTALRRIGPGPLYLERGYRLAPALPPGARARLYGVEGGSIVVVGASGAHRLALDGMMPIWALWLGPKPRVEGGLSEAAAALLRAMDEVLEPAAEDRQPRGGATAAEPTPDRAALFADALRDQESGQTAEAARKLELAGDFHRAARLYELAAQEAAEATDQQGRRGGR